MFVNFAKTYDFSHIRFPGITNAPNDLRTTLNKLKQKQLEWETVDERRDYFAAVLMYRCLNGEAPFYIANHFTRVSHNYFTRRSQYDAIIPKPNLDVFKRSFLYQGPVLWNNLTQDIKSCNSLACFKRMYKRTYCA